MLYGLLIAALVSGVFASTADVPYRECSLLVEGHAPKPGNDTPEAFLSFDQYSHLAKDAKTPEGYSLLFDDEKVILEPDKDKKIQVMSVNQMTEYDPEHCAKYCKLEKGCNVFNTFVHRRPVFLPGKKCDNPKSSVDFKCLLLTTTTTELKPTNDGYMDHKFKAVFAASNGYKKLTKRHRAPRDPTKSFEGYRMLAQGNTTLSNSTATEPAPVSGTPGSMISVTASGTTVTLIDVVTITETDAPKGNQSLTTSEATVTLVDVVTTFAIDPLGSPTTVLSTLDEIFTKTIPVLASYTEKANTTSTKSK